MNNGLVANSKLQTNHRTDFQSHFPTINKLNGNKFFPLDLVCVNMITEVLKRRVCFILLRDHASSHITTIFLISFSLAYKYKCD